MRGNRTLKMINFGRSVINEDPNAGLIMLSLSIAYVYLK